MYKHLYKKRLQELAFWILFYLFQMTSTKKKENNLVESLVKCGLKKEDFMEKCSICKKFYRGKFELNEHYAIHHKGEQWYCQTPGCNKEYKTINGYRYHLFKCH